MSSVFRAVMVLSFFHCHCAIQYLDLLRSVSLAASQMALCYSMDSVLLLYLLSSLTVPTFAMLSQLSQITPRASMLNLVSPPNPLITRAATVDGNLFARGIATCGYISGNGASPLTCPAGYTCTSTVQHVVGWACCNQIQCVGNCKSEFRGITEPVDVLSCSAT